MIGLPAAQAAGHSAARRLPLWILFLAGSLFALPFVLALALGNSLSHDEHQHVAAGVLFSRDGLLPYRDFAYFHVPYLVYVYGVLFKFSSHYLLVSRLFSAVCAALTAGAVFSTAWALFFTRPAWQRMAIGLGSIALLLSAPVFFDTVGHSWNQEPSTLLALLGFLCHYTALNCQRPGKRLFLSGVLLGLAIGMRVTLAPLVLPFAVMLWLASPSRRMRQLLLFGAGIALALLPAAWSCLSGPAGFVFGNVEFPKVNIEFRLASGEPRTMTLSTKLRFFFKLVMRPNWMLFYSCLLAGLIGWLRIRTTKLPALFCFLLVTLPFLMIGGLAPSPAFDQYYYPMAPFLLAGILSILAGIVPRIPATRWMWGAAAALVLVSSIFAAGRYEEINDIFNPQRWSPSKLMVESAELRRLVPEGRVLTLAPIFPLEAGLQIYPEFATGPFAWRVAAYVPRARRATLHMVAAEDLAARLENDPPAAILLGFEKRWEEPLASYAQSHGYKPISFSKDKQLWLAPGRAN